MHWIQNRSCYCSLLMMKASWHRTVSSCFDLASCASCCFAHCQSWLYWLITWPTNSKQSSLIVMYPAYPSMYLWVRQTLWYYNAFSYDALTFFSLLYYKHHFRQLWPSAVARGHTRERWSPRWRCVTFDDRARCEPWSHLRVSLCTRGASHSLLNPCACM